ncbi:MAG: dihydroorotase [Bdellovibrionota bacterium]
MTGKRILITGGKVIDPSQHLAEERDLLIEDGLVKGIEKPGSFQKMSGVEVVDASGLLVTPGLHDIHVHFREPGQEWKETILTGSQAAVAGGFTTVCCMPNTVPDTDCASVAEFILKQAAAANLCRVYPIGAITLGRKSKALAPMLELKEAGCVAFSDDGAPVSDAGLMRRALEYNLMLGTVLTVHEEEKQLSNDFSAHESARSLRMGLKGMPGAAEDVMISRDIELARLTGGRVHFCHVSTARAVTLIRRAKEDGIPVTAEGTPHHFTLTDEAIEDYNTQAKVSMPLRSESDRSAVLAGVREGVLDCIASDHAPHEADSKACEFDKASFGFLGLQTTLPLTLAKVRSGELSLSRAIECLTTAPARCFNLRQPSLKAGSVADITIIDENRRIKHTADYIRSKSKNTPFLGQELVGHAVRTYVSGREVYNIDSSAS